MKVKLVITLLLLFLAIAKKDFDMIVVISTVYQFVCVLMYVINVKWKFTICAILTDFTCCLFQDHFKSAYFFFEGVFYNDMRFPECQDISM